MDDDDEVIFSLPTTSIDMKSPTESEKTTPKSSGFLTSPLSGLLKRSPRPKSHTLGANDEEKWRAQSDSQVPTALNHSSPPALKRAHKSFPRTFSMTSGYSEGSTLLNPASPRLHQRQLEEEQGLLIDNLNGLPSSESVWSPSLPSLQIAGITVRLSKPISKALGIKLVVNGRDFVKLPFLYDHLQGDWAEPLRWELQPPFTMHPNTRLDIQVLRRRIWPKNPHVVTTNLNYNDACEALVYYGGDGSEGNRSYYPHIIRASDPVVVAELVTTPSLQETLDNATDLAKQINGVLSSLGKGRRFLEAVIAYGAAISEIDPIAKAVMGCVKVTYQILLEQHKCDSQVTNLAASMARTISYIEDVQQFARLAQLKRALEDVRPLMEDTSNFILRYVNRERRERNVIVSTYQDEIDSLQKRFQIFAEQFDRGVQVQTGGTVEAILEHLLSTKDEAILQELKPKGLEAPRLAAECMEGTRTDVLSWIDDWIDDPNAKNILWVRGFPGVGKSSIASTVITNLRARNRLGSRFAFEREKATVSTPNVLWRSVAWDLARQYPPVRKAIVERLEEEDVDVETSNVKALFRELIEEPLCQLEDPPSYEQDAAKPAPDGALFSADEVPKPHQPQRFRPIPPGRLPVIVIDALDECGGRDGRRSIHREGLLQTLKRWPNVPRKFKLIVTSRIEDDITRVLHPISDIIDLSTGEQVEEQASSDINLFFRRRFSKLAKQYSTLEGDWPGEEVCDDLTRRAAGLFLWAKTAFEFVNIGEPTQQLELLQQGVGLGDVALLYAKVLEVSFRIASPGVIQAFQDVVGAVVFAKRPLAIEEMMVLYPGLTPTMLEYVEKGIASVLDSAALAEEPRVLRFSHQSFVEFLLNSDKCPEVFRMDETVQHRKLAEVTLRIMQERLMFNIVRFPTSDMKNAALVDLDFRAETFIGTPLIYACRFWMDHVQMLDWDEEVFEWVKEVILDKLLFWLEVLSAIGEIYVASVTLKALLGWCRDNADEEFIDFIVDALKFLDAFNTVMAQSLPHIYISALPFAPSNSKVAQRFRSYFPRTVRVEQGKFAEWPRVVYTVDEHEHEARINSAAFSSDGRFLVSGSNDKTVKVWDAETGDLVSGPLEEHTDYVGTVAFFPGGKYIASGSDDGTIRLWETESGDEVFEDALRGHGAAVTCVAFSNSGRFLASASYDKMVMVWDVSALVDGTPVQPQIINVFGGHGGAVMSVAYSPDDTMIVSGSADGTVWVRDAFTGGLLYGYKKPEEVEDKVEDEEEDEEGEREAVSAYEEHETCVVALADLEDGEELLPFHDNLDCVTCVTFSPDGKKVAAASEDETILIWDLERPPTNSHFLKLEGHTDGVTSIAFSADGRRLISGSHDGIIIVWNTETGDIICEPFTGHRNGVTSVAFSPSGHRILSSSCDKQLMIWDAECGTEDGERYRLTPFLDIPAHQDNVKSVAFSPDGLRIVSSSDDETIRLWDAETGEPINEVRFHREDLAGHHIHRFPCPPSHLGSVDVVAYSPDGAYIASGSGSGDGEVCIWDAETGKLRDPVLRGHRGGIISLVFLPDSKQLVSSSYDRTIRVWDVESGETVLGPLMPYPEGWITSTAVSPDGTKIASATNDFVVRILDAVTGEQIGEELKGRQEVINCLAFTPDSRLLVSGSYDKSAAYAEIGAQEDEETSSSIRVWNVSFSPDDDDEGGRFGELKWELVGAHEKHILCLAISPNGKYVASASADETIMIWDLETKEPVLGPLEGHTSTIFSIAFNHDGTRLVSSSEDEVIRVWDVSSVDIRGCFVGARPAEFSDSAGYRQGWIVKSRRLESDSLLLWVPPWCRSGVWWPRNTAVISEVSVKLDLRTFVHGEDWHQCYEPAGEED